MNARNPVRWAEWVANIKAMAARGNIIAANNLYDVHYIKYHTGLDAEYIPSWCGGEGQQDRYAPVAGRAILVGPYRDNLEGEWDHPILKGLRAAVDSDGGSRLKQEVHRMSDLYKTYKWEEIVQHPAVILLPYQVSSMSFFELYRRNMPLFAPSLSLLARWTREHGIMWERKYGEPPFIPHKHMDAEPGHPDDPARLEYWLGLSDYYSEGHFPNVTLFDSWGDLIVKLASRNLRAISAAMASHNERAREQLTASWRRALAKARGRSSWPLAASDDFDEAMTALWGASKTKLPPDSANPAVCGPDSMEKSKQQTRLVKPLAQVFGMGQVLDDHESTASSLSSPNGRWNLRVRKGTILWLHDDVEVHRFPLLKLRGGSQLTLKASGDLCMFSRDGTPAYAKGPDFAWWCHPTGCTELCTIDLDDEGDLYVRGELTKQRTKVPFPIAPTNWPRVFWLGVVVVVALAGKILRKLWRSPRMYECLVGSLSLLRGLIRALVATLVRAAKLDIVFVRLRSKLRTRLFGKTIPL